MRNVARLAVLWLIAAAAPAQAVFTPVPVFHPIGGPLVFDGQRILMSSDGRRHSSGGFYGREMWSLQGSNWSYVQPAFPEVYVMAHDPGRNRIVALEGSTSVTLREWDGTTSWQQITMPGPLVFCRQWQLCYDPSRSATVVLGYDIANNVHELWSYGITGWQQLGSGQGPGYGVHRLVPTPSGDLLWIGLRSSTLQFEMWRWNASGWTQLANPPVTGVPVCDPVTLQLFLVSAPVGGNVAVWTFTGGAWSLVASGGPTLAPVTAVHDGQRIVMHGGQVVVPNGGGIVPDGQTWSFQSGVFTPLAFPQPQNLGGRVAVFDSWNQRTLIVGWFAGNRETWWWDGVTFLLLERVSRVFTELKMAFDEVRGVAVLLEGDGSTWEWNGLAWTSIGGAGFGPARPKAGMAFDGQRVVLYGGFDENNFTRWNETRLYDGVTWTLAAPSTPPPLASGESQLVHDPSRGRTVLIHGALTSLYEWNGSNWSAAATMPWAPATMPRSRYFAGFQPARGRVAFGGGLNQQGGGEVGCWEWDGAVFRTLPTKFAIGACLVRQPDGEAMLYGAGDWSPTPVVERLSSVNPATLTEFGAGCVGSAGVPAITAEPWQAAWLGGTFRAQCTAIPSPGVAFWVLGFSNTTANGVPLPADLGVLGAPGCSELVSIDWIQFAVASAGAVTLALPVPLFAVGLVGQRAHAQVLVADPLANAAGFVVSDAMTFRVGVR